MLGTVVRAGDLLDLFDRDQPEWGATAVSRRLGITKSQAHEMLVSLECIGLLRRSGQGRFRLGWKMVSMSRKLLGSEVAPEDLATIRELAKQARTSVDLVVHDGVSCVRIAGVGAPTYSLGSAMQTGKISAAGKVLLAGMKVEAAEAHLATLGLSLDPAFEAELDAIRAEKVAFEADHDRRAVAAPVYDADRRPLAALCLAVKEKDWDQRSTVLTLAVTGTAKRLSRSFRYRRGDAFVMGEPGLSAASERDKIAV